jgi:hypothetical protein
MRQMKNAILTGLLLASGLGCQGTTSIGGTDASNCNVTFPEMGFYGPNILLPGSVSFVSGRNIYDPMNDYELVVQHDAAAPVTVYMTLLSGSVWYVRGQADDWHVGLFDGNSDGGTGSQEFEAPNVTGEFEESISFQYSGQARLDIYECGGATPTLSKTISWLPPDGGAVAPPPDAELGDDASVQILDGGIPPGEPPPESQDGSFAHGG